MRKINKQLRILALSLVAIGIAPVHAETIAQDSVVTVDQLLKIDNAKARKKAQEDALAAGLGETKPAPGDVKTSTTTPSRALARTPQKREFTVESISAIMSNYSIRLKHGGVTYENAKVGSNILGCTIAVVIDQCVVFATTVPLVTASAPVDPKKSTASSAKPAKPTKVAKEGAPPMLCPTACWSGVQAQQAQIGPKKDIPPLPPLGAPPSSVR